MTDEVKFICVVTGVAAVIYIVVMWWMWQVIPQ